MGLYRKAYTVAEKLWVLSFVDKNGVKAALLEFHIGKSSLYDWLTNKKKLVAIKNKKLKKLGSGKRPFFRSYELDLQEIVSNIISSGLPINKLGVKNEMKLLLQKNTNPKYKNIISKFKYSYGWVNGFTKRFSLVLRKPTTENVEKYPGIGSSPVC